MQCSLPAGTVSSAFGAACSVSTTAITVLDDTGFQVGDNIGFFDFGTGLTRVGFGLPATLTVLGIQPSPTPYASHAGILSVSRDAMSAAVPGCVPAFAGAVFDEAMLLRPADPGFAPARSFLATRGAPALSSRQLSGGAGENVRITSSTDAALNIVEPVLPAGYLGIWDAPMPPALVTLGIEPGALVAGGPEATHWATSWHGANLAVTSDGHGESVIGLPATQLGTVQYNAQTKDLIFDWNLNSPTLKAVISSVRMSPVGGLTAGPYYQSPAGQSAQYDGSGITFTLDGTLPTTSTGGPHVGDFDSLPRHVVVAASDSWGRPVALGYWSYPADAPTADSATLYVAPSGGAVGVSSPSNATVGKALLPAGWGLIANPFQKPAKVSANLTTYFFDGMKYVDTNGEIPIRGTVWVFNGAGAPITVTLTAQ